VVSGEYLRRQADLCLQLAQVSDQHVAARLIAMATQFRHKAREVDDAPSIVPQAWGSGQRRT
jgi:hypothetical protein